MEASVAMSSSTHTAGTNTGPEKVRRFKWRWIVLLFIVLWAAFVAFPTARALVDDNTLEGSVLYVLSLLFFSTIGACLLAVFYSDDAEAMRPLRDNVGAAWLAVLVAALLSFLLNDGVISDGISDLLGALLTVYALLGVMRSALHLAHVKWIPWIKATYQKWIPWIKAKYQKKPTERDKQSKNVTVSDLADDS